jgi:crotonobetainyl-CoA:carnitine CoA-transferase CaiB-like acyl-CoA transferase
VSLADSVAALYAVIGALMALRRPHGEVVDVALYEGVYSLMESLVPDYQVFDVQPERAGSSLPGVVPSNTYRCADGRYAVVSGNGDAIFGRLMRLVGRPDLADDPALADNAGRVPRRDELDAAIGAWTAAHPLDAVLVALDGAAVPAGPIYTPADIAKDPHYAARGMHERRTVALSTGEYVDADFPGIVPRLAREPGATRWLGPELGADTDAICETLGIGRARRSTLRAAGVIG